MNMEPPASTSTPLLQDTNNVVAPTLPAPQLSTSSSSSSSTTTTEPKAEQTHITLHVISQSGDSLQFKVRMTTPLQKVIDAYCSRMNVSEESVRFLYDGDRVKGINTPEIMDLEDGDIIDVVLQQTGGGGGFFASLSYIKLSL